MDRKICNEADEKFLIYPSDLNVVIRKIKPFYATGTNPIIINCRRKDSPNFKSLMNIKVKPKYGVVYLIEPYILIYKAKRYFYGMDMFQVFFQDEVGGTHIESVLINVKRG